MYLGVHISCYIVGKLICNRVEFQRKIIFYVNYIGIISIVPTVGDSLMISIYLYVALVISIVQRCSYEEIFLPISKLAFWNGWNLPWIFSFRRCVVGYLQYLLMLDSHKLSLLEYLMFGSICGTR